MLKLTCHVYQWGPQAELFDYYERTLLNHVMAQQHPRTGMFTYMTPMLAGEARGWSSPFDDFWCCVGSGMEAHAQFGDSIYWQDGQGRLHQFVRALHGARRRRPGHDLAQRIAGAGQRLATHRCRAARATHARTARAGLGATTAPATQWPTCRWQRQRWLSTHHARLAARRYPEPVVRHAAAPGSDPGRSRLGLGAARAAGACRRSGRRRQAVVGQDPGIDRRPGHPATPAAGAGQHSLRLQRWLAAVAVVPVLRPVRPPQRGLPGTPRRRRMATTSDRTGGSRRSATRTRHPRARSHRAGR